MVAGAITVSLTYLIVRWPVFFASTALVLSVIAALKIAKGGCWRRSYILTIVSMGAGASHITAIAPFGNLAKVLALAVLTMATFLSTRNQESRWGGNLHRIAVFSLWITATIALASILWSSSRLETLVQSLIFVAFVYILHETSTVRWKNRNVLYDDIRAGYFAALFLLLLGMILATVGFPEAVSSFSGRHQGIFNNPNLLGMISALTAALGLGVASHQRSWILWLSITIPVSQVILSESRTSMIALAIAIIWVIARKGPKTIVFSALISGAIFTATWNAASKALFEVFDRFLSADGTAPLNSRTLAWTQSLDYLSSNPMGVGWAATTALLDSYREDGIGSGLSSIHNSYLQIIFELGWIALIPLALINVLLIGTLVKVRPSGLNFGLVALTLAGAVIQFTESAIFGIGQPYPYLFWFGLIAALTFPQEANRPQHRSLKSPRYETEASTNRFLQTVNRSNLIQQ